MIVLSLFDGMSCGQLALNRVNIKPTKYFASEIDKYAIKVTQTNFPNTIQLGDVTKLTTRNGKLLVDGVEHKVDLLIGGFPCQSFSFSGKGLGFEDERGKLFFEVVRLLKELNPRYFLFENVKMKKEHEAYINSQIGVSPVLINSALVSAQNRQRLYWTNIPNVVQPLDLGITLSSILEDGIVDRDKAHCLDANYFKGGNLKSYFEKHRRQLVFMKQLPRGYNKGFCKETTKCSTLSSNSWQYNNFISQDGVEFRKLTPIECERLQTIPDNYTSSASNSQRYKMLGNGWTVDVIAHIFKNIN